MGHLDVFGLSLKLHVQQVSAIDEEYLSAICAHGPCSE